MRRKLNKRQQKLRDDNIRKKLEQEKNNCSVYKLLKYIKLKIHSFNNKE
jgi:hypothetical protein